MLKSILLKSRQTTTKKKRESVEESNRKHALDDASARRLELHVLLVWKGLKTEHKIYLTGLHHT